MIFDSNFSMIYQVLKYLGTKGRVNLMMCAKSSLAIGPCSDQAWRDQFGARLRS